MGFSQWSGKAKITGQFHFTLRVMGGLHRLCETQSGPTFPFV